MEMQLHTLVVEDINNLSAADLVPLFTDADFTENTEYFREDTLEKGYPSEAHRLCTEATLEDPEDQDAFEKIVTSLLDAQYDNSTYYRDHQVVFNYYNDNQSAVISWSILIKN